MFQHLGIWLPDGEKHFPDWMTKNGEIVDGKGTYQIRKWRACIPHIKQWRVAVDVGAHVGLWSMQLVKRFEVVVAFEPVMVFRQCWSSNVEPAAMCDETCESMADIVAVHRATHDRRAILAGCALGAAPGRVSMVIPPLDGGLDTGGTHVGGAGEIEMRTLDSFDLQDVDFLKIDCEGYEHHVIAGARETLLRCKPCVIVEQKPHKLGPNFGIQGTPAVDLLKALGYRVVTVMSGDYICVAQ